MIYQPYLDIEEVLASVGNMSSPELANYLGVSKVCMANWLSRWRKHEECKVRIVSWEITHGNRREVYGISSEADVPEPPVNNAAAKKKWNNTHNLLRDLRRAKTANKTVRKNNLFGVSFT